MPTCFDIPSSFLPLITIAIFNNDFDVNKAPHRDMVLINFSPKHLLVAVRDALDGAEVRASGSCAWSQRPCCRTSLVCKTCRCLSTILE